MHLEPKVANGHFNVLRGALKAPIDLAGVKVVGDFVDNYKLGFPSELAVLLLLDPAMGAPKAILDASGITDMRTGAVTAIGAKYLGAQGRQGARPYRRPWHSLLERAPAQPPLRLRRNSHSFPAPREPRGVCREQRQNIGKPVTVTEDWRSCVEGADIVVEASRLSEPQPLLLTDRSSPARLLCPTAQ